MVDQGHEHTALSTSRVTFSPLTEVEIAQYWDTGEPADKAGAYAVQGKAAAFIERLEGSYSGVMGLPLHELSGILKKIGKGAT
jgi:septum formation protein